MPSFLATTTDFPTYFLEGHIHTLIHSLAYQDTQQCVVQPKKSEAAANGKSSATLQADCPWRRFYFNQEGIVSG